MRRLRVSLRVLCVGVAATVGSACADVDTSASRCAADGTCPGQTHALTFTVRGHHDDPASVVRAWQLAMLQERMAAAGQGVRFTRTDAERWQAVTCGPSMESAWRGHLVPSNDPESRSMIDERGPQLEAWLAGCEVDDAGTYELHTVNDAPSPVMVFADERMVLVDRGSVRQWTEQEPTEAPAPFDSATRTVHQASTVTGQSMGACLEEVGALCANGCTAPAFSAQCPALFDEGGPGDCRLVHDMAAGPDLFCAWRVLSNDQRARSCAEAPMVLAGESVQCVQPVEAIRTVDDLQQAYGNPAPGMPCHTIVVGCAGGVVATEGFELIVDENYDYVGELQACADELDTQCRLCQRFGPSQGPNCGDCFDLLRPETEGRALLAACVATSLDPRLERCVNARARCLDINSWQTIRSYEQLILSLPGFFDALDVDVCLQQTTTCIRPDGSYLDYEQQPPNYDPFASTGSSDGEGGSCPN